MRFAGAQETLGANKTPFISCPICNCLKSAIRGHSSKWVSPKWAQNEVELTKKIFFIGNWIFSHSFYTLDRVLQGTILFLPCVWGILITTKTYFQRCHMELLPNFYVGYNRLNESWLDIVLFLATSDLATLKCLQQLLASTRDNSVQNMDDVQLFHARKKKRLARLLRTVANSTNSFKVRIKLALVTCQSWCVIGSMGKRKKNSNASSTI